MAKKDDLIYIEHILESAKRILKFTHEATFESFIKNEMMQSAVVRELEIIGEASKRISNDFRDNNETVPWRKMTGMRDKLIHDYFEVEYNLVWDTIENNIIELVIQLEKILENK